MQITYSIQLHLCYMVKQRHEFYFGVVKMIFYKWAQILLLTWENKNVHVIFLVSGLTTSAIQEFIMVSVAWYKYCTCRVFSLDGMLLSIVGEYAYLWICTPERSEAFLEHHVQEPSKSSKPDQTISNLPNQLSDHHVSSMLQSKSLFWWYCNYLLSISFQQLCNQASNICTILVWDRWVGTPDKKNIFEIMYYL